MKKYLLVWRQLAICSFGSTLSTKIDGFGYLAGKCIRLIGFWVMIEAIFRGTSVFGGYTKYEVLLFFLTFYVLDVCTQVFLRGVYLFRSIVRKGDFDYLIIKPINTLFLVMTRLTDFLDALFLLPLLVLWLWVMSHIGTITGVAMLGYLFFATLSLALIVAIHILVAATTVLTTENQHVIWLYRESMRVGQFPPNILPKGLQTFFTFLFPIIIIVAFPVKALLGELTVFDALVALGITAVFFVISLSLWYGSLRRYSSASS